MIGPAAPASLATWVGDAWHALREVPASNLDSSSPLRDRLWGNMARALDACPPHGPSPLSPGQWAWLLTEIVQTVNRASGVEVSTARRRIREVALSRLDPWAVPAPLSTQDRATPRQHLSAWLLESAVVLGDEETLEGLLSHPGAPPRACHLPLEGSAAATFPASRAIPARTKGGFLSALGLALFQGESKIPEATRCALIDRVLRDTGPEVVVSSVGHPPLAVAGSPVAMARILRHHGAAALDRPTPEGGTALGALFANLPIRHLDDPCLVQVLEGLGKGFTPAHRARIIDALIDRLKPGTDGNVVLGALGLWIQRPGAPPLDETLERIARAMMDIDRPGSASTTQAHALLGLHAGDPVRRLPLARQPAAGAWLLVIHAAGIPVPFADASASFRHVDVPWLRSLPHLRQAIKAWQDLAAAGRLPGWVVMQSLWALKIAAMPPPPAWEADCLDQLAWGLVEDLEKGPIPPADWARRLLLSASRLPTPPRSPVWAAVAAIVSQDPPAPGCLEAASDEDLARLATLLQGLPLSLKSPSLEALARAIAIDRRLPCGQAGPSRGRM